MTVAQIAHQLPGRVRMRIPEKRGDSQYFEQLRQAVGAVPGVKQVVVNPLTASVLVLHDDALPLGQLAAQWGLKLAAAPPQVVERLGSGLQTMDSTLRGVSSGQLDLRGTALLGLLGMGLYQAAQGEVLAPAVTLFWYAFALSQTPEGSSVT